MGNVKLSVCIKKKEMQIRIFGFICLFWTIPLAVTFAQNDVVKYYINERDTSIYHDTVYVFDELRLREVDHSFRYIIKRLSANKHSEMYVLRLTTHRNKCLIVIQNWKYCGLNELGHGKIYGMYRSVAAKDFLVCYDGANIIRYLRTLFYKTNKKNKRSIKVETIPNDVHVLSDDISTYYVGMLVDNRLETQKFILNNKLIGGKDGLE